MRIEEVISYLESWFPSASALTQDNPGLQVGDPTARLKNVLVTLEVTDRVIEEAIENQVNLILTHHPLIYNPFSNLNTSAGLGKQIAQLVANGITVYAAHTNLDVSRYGVSMVLAQLLGIQNPQFLTPAQDHWQKKLVVFIPITHVEAVRQAMVQAGAGVIGDYTHCSFHIAGTGTFLGEKRRRPAWGKKVCWKPLPKCGWR